MVAMNSFMKWIGLCWDVFRKLTATHSFVIHWSHINVKPRKGHASYTNKKCTPRHISLFDIKYHTLTNLLSCTFILKRKTQTSMWHFNSLKDTHLIHKKKQNKTAIVTEDPLSKGKTQDFLFLVKTWHKNIDLGVDIFLN